MSELNIFLSALQSAFADSVAKAVASATAPLVERIEKLETNCTPYDILHKNQHDALLALRDRIAALESGPSAIVEEQRGIDDELMRVKQRIEALETTPAGTPVTDIVADAFFTHLDNQEWFWEKLTRKAHEVAEAAAEAAMDDHLGTYDHDEYDNHLGDDDKHFDGDIEDAVRDALNGTSVTLSF